MVTTRSGGRANNAASPLVALSATPKRKRTVRERVPEPVAPSTLEYKKNKKDKKDKKDEEEEEEEEEEEDVGLFWKKDKRLGRKTTFSSPRPSFLPPPPPPLRSPPSEVEMWRRRALAAEARVAAAEARVVATEAKVVRLEHVLELYREEASKWTGQVSANSFHTDVDMSVSANETEAQAEFLVGSDEAIALLRKIERSAKEPRGAPPSEGGTEDESAIESAPPAQQASTPAPRPTSTPGGFFSRSFSAIKSKLGFATPTAPVTSGLPPATAPILRAAPGSFTEVLSTPPTPVGERKPTRPKKAKQNPMTKLLTKGVEPDDMPRALEWVRQTIPEIYNRSDSTAVRKRLQQPVLIQDLEHFPSSKPWESGFGDPLGEMEDDEVVPVWAVYLAILAEEEEPKRKKAKVNNEVTMEDDATPSLDELVAAASSAQDMPQIHDSHGMSASHLDLHPRRSMEPSPFFSASTSHQQGNNIFREQQGQEETLNLQTDREALHAATKKAVANHNPSQGSFGLDYDDDEDDSSILTDNSDCDGSSSHLWTQPPPPAPVPAHAPLPGGATADSPGPSSEQPVDEIERQRQKLMKHTPAKPSRLREAFVPSPSLLSEAGNTSILMGSPLAGPGLYDFDDMPDAEDLGLTDDDWANVDALNNDTAYQASQAAVTWPDPVLTYDSDEETLSPE
ncbi:hypothetical protein DE146DRAFT_262023 [Phaeosphaeria sp. MPI-PUGE-AT-0046c]|nr:hypothetical protein DE146DRAFT_262023 [Phaeosphaeria sp. MPI-PUGE-AT-0046c]